MIRITTPTTVRRCRNTWWSTYDTRQTIDDALKTHLGNANTMSSTITVAPNSHIASQMLIPRLILNYFDRKYWL